MNGNNRLDYQHSPEVYGESTSVYHIQPPDAQHPRAFGDLKLNGFFGQPE